MLIINDIDSIKLTESCAVAIGKFDGVHLGHRVILDRLLEKKKEGLLAAVFTFNPSPEAFFTGVNEELSTVEEKRDLFEALGIDILVEFPMNKENAAIPAVSFAQDILLKGMRARYIVAGTDLSFGDRGLGNAALLKEMAIDGQFAVDIVDKVLYEDEVISSTLIRKAVTEGDMKKAAALLGCPYRISGEVIHGKALGRTKGMPTINISPESGKVLPPYGVYKSVCHVGNNVYKSITDIGIKPTVSSEYKVGIETFIYDFDEDIYGDKVTVELLSYVRPEVKFSSEDELFKQIAKDIEACR